MTDNTFITDIYSLMSSKQILLTYLGEITPGLTNTLLTIIKHDNKAFEEEVVVKKKVYKIIVECLENVCRYSKGSEHNLRSSIFLFGKSDGYYHIITGNYINFKQAEKIKEKIKDINSLNREKLMDKHSQVLSEGVITDMGGAGLGLIDIALKSRNKLEYQFMPVEGSSVLFYILKVQVDLPPK